METYEVLGHYLTLPCHPSHPLALFRGCFRGLVFPSSTVWMGINLSRIHFLPLINVEVKLNQWLNPVIVEGQQRPERPNLGPDFDPSWRFPLLPLVPWLGQPCQHWVQHSSAQQQKTVFSADPSTDCTCESIGNPHFYQGSKLTVQHSSVLLSHRVPSRFILL